MLRKVLREHPGTDWEDLLECVCHAYRTSVHFSTGEIPYYLLHGRDPNTAVGIILSAVPDETEPTDYLSELQERLRRSFERVRKENAAARERQCQ